MLNGPWDEIPFFYTDSYQVPLPEGHRFPMQKYRMLRERLVSEGILASSQLTISPTIDEEDLLLVHTSEYVEGLRTNSLGAKLARPIGLPITPELFTRSLASVGGFVRAAEVALEKGFSAQLAGGTHHAFADHGEGFCVFNDFAVAAMKLLAQKRVRNILILDLDVHQGNGTSAILGNSKEVFITSIHGERNYPFRKVASHLDVPLPAGIGDKEYHSALAEVLERLSCLNFDILFYQAGVDILEHDTLGSFKLSFEGIVKRDEMVFEFARARNLPVAMAIGGGYSSPIELTVQAHVGTFATARNIFAMS